MKQPFHSRLEMSLRSEKLAYVFLIVLTRFVKLDQLIGKEQASFQFNYFFVAFTKFMRLLFFALLLK